MSITLGPFAFATSQLIFIVACAVAFFIGWIANQRAKSLNVSIGDALFRIIVVGLLCARGVFVIKYFDSYAASPWAILNVRDGGFVLWAGLIGGALWTWREWWLLAQRVSVEDSAGNAKQQSPRRAQLSLIVALVIGLSVAAVGNLWLQKVINQTQLPQLTLISTQGQPVQTAQAFLGQPAVINLWASWCPPCIREMPHLERAASNWPDIQVVAINQGENRQVVQQFLDQHELELPMVLLDGDSQMGSLIGSHALPTTLFFNSDGSLSYTHIGEFSAATLENALRRLH